MSIAEVRLKVKVSTMEKCHTKLTGSSPSTHLWVHFSPKAKGAQMSPPLPKISLSPWTNCFPISPDSVDILYSFHLSLSPNADGSS